MNNRPNSCVDMLPQFMIKRSLSASAAVVAHFPSLKGSMEPKIGFPAPSKGGWPTKCYQRTLAQPEVEDRPSGGP